MWCCSGVQVTIDISSQVGRSIYQMCALDFFASFFFKSSPDIYLDNPATFSAEFGLHLISSLHFLIRGHQTKPLSKTINAQSQPLAEDVAPIVGSSTSK